MRRALSVLLAAFGLGLLLGVSEEAEAKKGKTFLYLHDNGGSPEIHGFEVTKDGALTELPGSPYALPGGGSTCGGACGTLTYSPGRKLLFVTTDSLVTVLSVAKDGTLTEVGGADPPSTPIGIATLKRGKRTFVYVNEFDEDRIRGYEVLADASLAELPFPPASTADEPDGLIAVGKHLISANESGSLSAFAGGKDGALTGAAGSPVAVAATFMYNLGADPGGKHVYVPDAQAEQIFGFSRDSQTGALTPLAGSPFETETEIDAGISVAKNLLFGVVRTAGPGVNVLSRANNGALTHIAVRDVGHGPLDGCVLSPNGKLLATWSGADDSVRIHRVSATGELTLADENFATLTSLNVPGAAFIQR